MSMFHNPIKSTLYILKCFIYISVVVLLTVSCGSTAQQQTYTSHAVQPGETAYSIAKDYNISESTLYNLNPDAKNGIKVNSILILPSKDGVNKGPDGSKLRTHKVQRKETLYGIALLYKVSVDEIKKLNKELYARELKTGEELIIPAALGDKGMINPNIGGPIPGTVEYTVKPKETKYGIARKFGISVAELEDLNPELGDEFKIGTVLIVPDESVVDDAEINVEDYQFYEVKAKEGFYRLKVKFGLTEEEIIALNPYAKDGLREGMVLKIPKEDGFISTDDISTVDLEKRIDNKKMKTIALMLPFRLNQNANDSTQIAEDVLKKDLTLRIALDFYSGALMAAEFAKDQGIPVTLDVYDTERSDSKVASIISNKDFKNTDAVIGPLLQKNVEKAASMLEKENIPVFSPLSNRDMAMNENLFQSLPTNSVLEKLMIQYIKSHASGKNVIIISDSKRQRQKEKLQAALPTAKAFSPRNDYIQATDISGLMSEGKENWVILESESPVLVSSAVNVLAAMPAGHNIRLFTLNKNEAYEWHEVSSTRLVKLNFTFPSVNRSYSENTREPFVISYKNKYGVAPNRFAIRGFDVTYDVLLRLASEKDIYDAVLPESLTSYIENKFRYEKTEEKGYANQAAYILKYNKELKFDIVE